MEQYNKIELWCCGRCAHEFFANEPECPQCGFACYRLLNIVAPLQVVAGSFRITRANKACSGRKATAGIIEPEGVYVAFRR